LPYEGSVDSRALVDAAVAAAVATGVELHAHAGVAQLITEGDRREGRCTGVVANGEHISAGNVVLAAGAFSARIMGVPTAVATRPVRGQMIALNTGNVRLRHVLRSERGYVVPRRDTVPEKIVAGSTLEDVQFEKRVTPAGLEHILAAAQELLSGISGAEVLETWCGLRPDTPDHLPIMGPADLTNLTIATGHYRNGILLAPITAKLVREWITEQRVSMDWELFSPQRFKHAAT
jgi:glycine oxidase